MFCNEKGKCGGCFYTDISYEEELKLKKQHVLDVLKDYIEDAIVENIIPSPLEVEYKNKMEFSFGDNIKDGPLILGMHQKKSFYNICEGKNCELVGEDVREVVKITEKYFRELKASYRHRKSGNGFLRHLVIRKSYAENKLLINLVTTSNIDEHLLNKEYTKKYIGDCSYILEPWMKELHNTNINIAGVCHTVNDSLSDTVQYTKDNIHILYGNDYIEEKLLGLNFRISLPSFFQTNTYGAEKLYSKVREYLELDSNNKIETLYDLYCGTGTISQILSIKAKNVFGVEIVEDAVRVAKENAKLNNINNAEFIAADVLEYCLNNKFDEDNSAIILDPPRSGVNSKALEIITSTNIKTIIYISCKCESLARDMIMLKAKGYNIKNLCTVDMFPKTDNVETVVRIEKE